MLKLMIQHEGRSDMGTLATAEIGSHKSGHKDADSALRYLKQQRDDWFFNGEPRYASAKYLIGSFNRNGEFEPIVEQRGTV